MWPEESNTYGTLLYDDVAFIRTMGIESNSLYHQPKGSLSTI